MSHDRAKHENYGADEDQWKRHMRLMLCYFIFACYLLAILSPVSPNEHDNAEDGNQIALIDVLV